jgi:hypothetical protein
MGVYHCTLTLRTYVPRQSLTAILIICGNALRTPTNLRAIILPLGQLIKGQIGFHPSGRVILYVGCCKLEREFDSILSPALIAFSL